MTKKIDLSLVIPVMDEAPNLQPLMDRISASMEQSWPDDMPRRTYEVLFIEDGSSDDSYKILEELSRRYQNIRVIRFKTNFGQTAALAAGFWYARGDVVITMDADLQNDPEDIPVLLTKMDEGYDVVSGWRKDRKDPFISRRLPSIIANKIISSMTGVAIKDFGCTLKAYKSEVVKHINLYGQMHRFVPALAKWRGAKIAEVPVKHHPRVSGTSKYGIGRTFRVILDLITVKFFMSYSSSPIQIFGKIGLSSGFLGMGIMIYLLVDKFVFSQAMGGRPMLFLALLLILMGGQFVSIGLLSEIQIRTYHESQNKPTYVVESDIDYHARNA